MWRAFFLAIGIFLIILGLEFLAVDRVHLRFREPASAAVWPLESQPKLGANKQVVPLPWWPWTMLSTGVVVCIYSFTLPKRVSGD